MAQLINRSKTADSLASGMTIWGGRRVLAEEKTRKNDTIHRKVINLSSFGNNSLLH